MILHGGQRELGVTPVNAVSHRRATSRNGGPIGVALRWECAFPNCRASAGNTQDPECDRDQRGPDAVQPTARCGIGTRAAGYFEALPSDMALAYFGPRSS